MEVAERQREWVGASGQHSGLFEPKGLHICELKQEREIASVLSVARDGCTG